MTGLTGLSDFNRARIAEDRASAAELPDRWRSLYERTFDLLESQLDEHQPDPQLVLGGEPLCTGCVEDVTWPCDFALQVASIWSDCKDYRPEWGDALAGLANH